MPTGEHRTPECEMAPQIGIGPSLHIGNRDDDQNQRRRIASDRSAVAEFLAVDVLTVKIDAANNSMRSSIKQVGYILQFTNGIVNVRFNRSVV